MNVRSTGRQRGSSLLGIFVLGASLGPLGGLAARGTPSIIEYQAVQAAVDKAKSGSTPDQMRQIFDRAAQVDGITSITGKDLEITRDNDGRITIDYAYDRQFRLGGPAYLVIKYAGKST